MIVAAFALPILQLCVEYKEKVSNQVPVAAGCGPPDDEKGKEKRQQQQQSLEPKFLMSTNDRDSSIAFHPDGNGLQLQSRDATKWAGCRCFTGVRVVSTGMDNQSSSSQNRTPDEGSVKGYSFECTVLDKKGLVRLGWSSDTASLQLGTDAGGYGYGGTGMKSHSNKYEAFPNKGKVQFSQGDVVGCHLKVFSAAAKGKDEPSKNGNNKADGEQNNDIAASIAFSKNGEMLGEAFKIIRTTNSLSLYPTICIKNSECEINFGGDQSKELKYDLPEGFEALAAAVKKGKATESPFVVNPCDFLAFQLAHQRNSKRKGPMAIVIEPTRDLAEQSYRAFADLGKRLQETPIQAALLVGGIKPTQTLGMLDQNEVDVLVGTPPIVASYMKKGTIQASRCRFFVLDEADELISTDSVDHIRSIYGRIVASTDPNQSRFERLQVCFFSATLHSKEVRDLAASICSKPMWVDLRGKNDSILPGRKTYDQHIFLGKINCFFALFGAIRLHCAHPDITSLTPDFVHSALIIAFCSLCMPTDTVHHCVVNITPTAPTNHRLVDDELIETDAVHRNGKLNAKIELNKLKDKASRDSECIKQLKPRVILDVMDKFSMEQVLIFCRTNLDCDLMEKFLKKIGGAGGMGVADKYSCRVLAGMRSMEERQKSLEDFKDGEVRILIATGRSGEHCCSDCQLF